MYVIERCRSYFPNEEFLSWGLGGSDHSRVEANVSRFAIEFRREAGGQQCQLLGIEPRRIERITLWNGLALSGKPRLETRPLKRAKSKARKWDCHELLVRPIKAFAVATRISRRYGSQHRWVPILAYGGGSAIGFSRLSLSAHYTPDVLVGAALGYSISRFAVLLADAGSRATLLVGSLLAACGPLRERFEKVN